MFVFCTVETKFFSLCFFAQHIYAMLGLLLFDVYKTALVYNSPNCTKKENILG